MAAFELQMFARAFPFRIIIYYHFSSVNIESARTISDDKQNCLSIFNSLDAWMLRNGLLLFIICICDGARVRSEHRANIRKQHTHSSAAMLHMEKQISFRFTG